MGAMMTEKPEQSEERRRPLEQVRADAEAFRALFPPACYERWEIAGSVRRGKPLCGDVDHVVIPRIGEVPSAGDLFGRSERVNLLWFHLDALVAGRVEGIVKHLYTSHRQDGTTSVAPKWGDLLRGVDFRMTKHEIWTADVANWGAQLAIRTGPGNFSQMLVTALQRNGYVNDGGYVQDKRQITCACGWAGPWGGLTFAESAPPGLRTKWANGHGRPAICPGCGQGDRLTAARVPVPTEAEYFRRCGIRWMEPGERR
jgi:DNA polymerase/3'-5' exonuclease PolX